MDSVVNKLANVSIDGTPQEKFIRELSNLLNHIKNKNKKSDEINELYDKFSIAKREVPEIIFNIAGPLLWPYRKEIKAKNMNALLNLSHGDMITSSITSAQSMGAVEIVEATELERMHQIIKAVKGTWHIMNPKERDVICEGFIKLIGAYALFLKLEKSQTK